jgi:hypothetical protein
VLLLTAVPRGAGLLARLLTPTRLGAARTGIGVVMVTRPALVPSAMGVDRTTAERMGWAVQMLGAREIALGMGAVVASRRGDRRAERLWLMAGLLSDAIDAVAVSQAVRSGRLPQLTGSAVAASSAGAAALELAALARR